MSAPHGHGCLCQTCQAWLQASAKSQDVRRLPDSAFTNQYRPCGDSSPVAGKCPCVLPHGHTGAHCDGYSDKWTTPAPEPTPTITRLAAQVTERLAVLDRVRPVLSDAIQAAKGEEAIQAVTLLGVRIMSAILKE